MDELTIGDKIYISSKRAAKITGYAKDYVGQLCREGRVEARLVGRNWYVLESSIREHRFGETEKVPVATSVSVTDSASVTESTWSSPRYEVEVPETVPPLLPKAEPFVSRKVVSEMHSAWQEWLNAQTPPADLLPSSSEDFDGSLLPSTMPEPVDDVEEEVHITRIESAPQAVAQDEEVTRVEVPLHRIETAAMAHGEERARSVSSFADNDETRVRSKTRPSLMLKSLFLGVAMLAAIIALIGTGALADILKQSGNPESKNSIIQYLGGQSEFSNM